MALDENKQANGAMFWDDGESELKDTNYYYAKFEFKSKVWLLKKKYLFSFWFFFIVLDITNHSRKDLFRIESTRVWNN